MVVGLKRFSNVIASPSPASVLVYFIFSKYGRCKVFEKNRNLKIHKVRLVEDLRWNEVMEISVVKALKK